MDKSRPLDYAERWMRDGLEVNQPPAFFQMIEVDMTSAKALLETARSQGIRLTYTHMIVRAAALALARNPDLHLLVYGSRVYSPAQVDIALSVAGDSFIAPVLVVEGADRKDLLTIAGEILERTEKVRAADRQMLQNLRRWGWLVPLAFLRRSLLRFLSRMIWFRRKGGGTFQVSLLQEVDYHLAPLFSTCGILSAGRVKDAVIAADGKPAVHPMMKLTCCGDHRIWDGRAGERILVAVRNILETGELNRELQPRLRDQPISHLG